MRNNLVKTLSVALAFGIWGCGSDTTGPGDESTNFDADATEAGLSTVEGAFETDAFMSLQAMGDEFAIPAASPAMAADFLEAATQPSSPDFAERISEAGSRILATSAAPAAVLIPEDYRGLTLTYTPDSGYAVDTTLTDAPANGIRFILYAVNPVTGEVSEPLTEIGYADLTDQGTETSAAIGLTVVSGGVTYLDYTVTLTGTIVAPTFTIEGFLSDGTEQADFTLAHSYEVNIAGVTITIDYDVSVGDFSMDLLLEIVAANDESTTITVDESFSDGTNTVTIDGTLEDEVGTLEVRGNDVLFATITIDSTSITVVNGEGEPLTEEEIQALEELIDLSERVSDQFEDLLHPVEFLFDN